MKDFFKITSYGKYLFLQPSLYIESFRSPQRAKEFLETLRVIKKANARVDSTELKRARAHFDSEQFRDGQERLVCFRRAIVEEIKKGNYDTARKYTGRLLHTLYKISTVTLIGLKTGWIDHLLLDHMRY